MPTFKIKDLMINLASGGAELRCVANTTRCPRLSDLTGCGICSLLVSCRAPSLCQDCSALVSCPVCSAIVSCQRCSIVSPVVDCLTGSRVGCADTKICFGSETPLVAETPEEIEVLRGQLKEQLELLDQREKLLNDQLLPQTLEDAELVEKKLTESLAEIKKIKEGLKKKK